MTKLLSKYLFVLMLISFSQLFPQKLSNKWELIKADGVSEIFIEPEKIVEYGNEISVWAIEKLREPRKSTEGENIISIKTHYLFNKVEKKYAEIGAIYYDERGAIVNRASKSAFAGGGPMAFMSSISTNPNAKIIYKEVISHLITGNITVADETQDYLNTNGEEEKTEDVPTEVETEEEITEDTEDNATTEIVHRINEQKEDNVKIDLSGINRKSTTLKELEKAKLPNFKLEKGKYDLSKERAVRNTIFTDGNLFCVQVSSWRKKASALREVKKLVAKGYNAYIVSVKPKHKRNIWHRVRVGYFNTLREAKRVYRKAR